MGRKTLISSDQREAFVEDYDRLKSVDAVAKKWNIGSSTVSRTLHRFGVTVARRGRVALSEEYHPKLGVWSDQRVADDLGVSKQAVSSARKRRGVESAYAKAMNLLSPD